MMSSDLCETYRGQLVDYADGELDAAESARIANHLAMCPACRRRLAALRTSLAAARRIWAETADGLTALPSGVSDGSRRAPARRRWPYRLAYGVAAAILLLLAYFVRLPGLPSGAPPNPTAASLAQVEEEIWEAGMAQQMLMTGRILSETPGGASYAAERYRFITEHFTGTGGAREARAQLAGPNERAFR